jgi:hypothetical protein
MTETPANHVATEEAMSWREVQDRPEYQEYHRKVVEECVRLMGKHVREFFDKQCEYTEGFLEGRPPEEEAQAQYEAMT